MNVKIFKSSLILEIEKLRKKLEQEYANGDERDAELVLDISRKLDRLIVEYYQTTSGEEGRSHS